jgi:hypothetical protein
MRRPEFTPRFNEVTAGETNSAVARRIGCTPAFISGLRSGIYGMGPELLARFVREYGLNLPEWQGLAGHLKEQEARQAAALERLRDLALEAARRAIETVSGAQRLANGLFELSQKYGRPVPVYLEGGAETLTVEEADKLLAEFDRQLAAEAATREAESADQAPIRLTAPKKGPRSTY